VKNVTGPVLGYYKLKTKINVLLPHLLLSIKGKEYCGFMFLLSRDIHENSMGLKYNTMSC